MVYSKLDALRNIMKEKNIDIYIVPTNDYHSSEYVGEHFKTREFISGFTGSAGTVVVTLSNAGLWTDGRYFIQAEKQLCGLDIQLYRMGNPNVPSVKEYIESIVKEGMTVGFDGRCMDASYAMDLKDSLDKKSCKIICEDDLVGDIWTDRPPLSAMKVYELPIKYSGVLASEKIDKIRESIKQNNCDYFVLSSLDDIAWLFNLRGADVDCNPVFLSYVVMDQSKVYLFANELIFSNEIKNYLEKLNVEIHLYNDIYSFLAKLPKDKSVMLDKDRVNYAIINSLLGMEILDVVNPTLLEKAKKNATEVENERIAHVKDGVAVTKFIFWLKENIGKMDITEISAAKYLENLRMKGENYIGPSFDPIVAYQENAAMCHYSATAESDTLLQPRGFVLFDTGGQYLEGTTDITRTITLGNPTQDEKLHYTLVLKGHLALGTAKFLYGTKGANLDFLARKPLWERGLDYNHGTGHGVGYLLNVHEGPNSIRWRIANSKCPNNDIMQEGMITSNEPGLYLEGKYGIRTENLIVCVKDQKTEYGQFLCFDTLTMVPYDLDSIDFDLLDETEKNLLNNYHKKVYETISPFMNDEELAWLKNATRTI